MMDLQRKKRIWKKTWPAVLMSVLLICFTHLLFAPVDLFQANASDMLFSLGDLLGVFVPAFLAATACGMICFFLLLAFPKKVYLAFIGAAFGLGLAGWIQGNLLNASNELLMGDMPDWQAERGTMLLNAAVWAALIIVPAVFAVRKSSRTLKVILWGSALILVMEAGSLGISLAGFDGATMQDRAYTTTKDELTFSDNGDVVVFMLDTLSTVKTDEVLENNPEYLDFLDGAVYYRNTSSSYQRTTPSFISMLTGKLYLNQKPLFVFSDEAFGDNPLFIRLMENGYTIDVYGEPANLFSSGLIGTIDNSALKQYRMESRTAFLRQYLALVEYRFGPKAFQPLLFTDFDDNINGLMKVPKGAYKESSKKESKYYARFQRNGLTIDSERKFFKYYHLNGIHVPWVFDREGNTHPRDEIDQYEAALGTFFLTGTIVNEMKVQGIYDQTTLIVLGDHGYGAFSNPAMFVKLPGQSGSLTVSEAPVELLDLPATILDAVGLDVSDLGTPARAWEGKTERERLYYAYTFMQTTGMTSYLADLTEYRVPADAKDADHYEPTGKIYSH